MASKLIGIVGATGTGKSTSIKHLNPEETYIINRFSASGDPVVKDLVKRIKENSKPQQDIFKE